MLDFVIVGLPRTGTSSLFQWLSDHPQIQGSKPKETFFLVDPDDPHAKDCSARTIHEGGMAAYQAFFPEPQAGRLRFEATTIYYRQRTALQALSEMPSRPLIVFVLRDPAYRMLSAFLYNREHYQNISRHLDFATYVDRLLAGDPKALSSYCTKEHRDALPNMLERGQYVRWLRLWRERVGSDRLHIILFEEMIADPGREMRRLCHRLGIDPIVYRGYAFQHHNKTSLMKHPSLHRMKRMLGPLLPGAVKRSLRDTYFRMQRRTPDLSEITSQTLALARLGAHYSRWNHELAEEFGLDLRTWKRPPATSD